MWTCGHAFWWQKNPEDNTTLPKKNGDGPQLLSEFKHKNWATWINKQADEDVLHVCFSGDGTLLAICTSKHVYIIHVQCFDDKFAAANLQKVLSLR